MLIKRVSKEETELYKGVGILLIVLHNLFHWMPPWTGENEFDFNSERIFNFFSGIEKYPLEFINLVFSYLGHYGVQIFIFISGLGVAYSMMNKNRSWPRFMGERLKKLYPLLIVGIIFYFFAIILMEQKIIGAWEWKEILYKLLFIHTLIPKSALSMNGPWWFFGLIFQLYVFFPLLFMLIKKYDVKAFLGICLFSYLCIYISQYLFSLEAEVYLLANSPGHLPEFAFGILIALNTGKKIHPSWFFTACVVFVLGNFYKLFFPLTFLSITVMFYWFGSKTLPKLVEKKSFFKKTILFYGSVSMILFAIHGFFRPPFITICGDIFWKRLLGAALFLIAVTALSILGNMLYRWLVRKMDAIISELSKKER